MEEIRKKDPILYCELTSNPTGSNGEDGAIVAVLFALACVIFTICVITNN